MNETQLRHTYRDKIFKYKAPWILKWGITVFLGQILLLLFVSGLISFPDTVIGVVDISAQNPPIPLYSKISGKIMTIFVKDGQISQPGDELILFESSVNIQHLRKMEDEIRCNEQLLNSDKIEFEKFNNSIGDYQLGELQSSYSDYSRKCLSLYQFITSNQLEKQIQAKENILSQQSIQKENIIENIKLQKKEYLLNKQQYDRDSLMYEKQISSKKQYESAQRGLMQMQYSLSNSNSTYTNINSSISQTISEIMILKLEMENQKRIICNELSQSADLLKSQISIWKQTFLLTAPIKGRVTFLTYWAENQTVQNGDLVLAIEPEQLIESKVRVAFPSNNAGKVKVGQKVKIKLDNYNFYEYGILTGVISHISKISIEKKFIADVQLSNGLITSYKKELPLGNYTGTAQIITKKQKLLSKFIKPLQSIISNSLKQSNE